MTDQTSIPDLIRQHFHSFLSGDDEAILALIDDDFTQDWPQSGERVRGREACLNIMRNYPGGAPALDIGRISGEGDHWVVEGTAKYPDGSDYHLVALLEFRGGKVVHETDYFGAAFPAPEWRKQWVEPLAG